MLTPWIRQAEQDAPRPIGGFAGFLRGDLDAVTAGLTLHCPVSIGVRTCPGISRTTQSSSSAPAP
ncbi:hypothetical protein AB4039_23715 [Streptomyces sp. M-16]|uniref:hypothetical protein n=1 Tax=Streptomyces sp. M-16 TaxID=3233040 RepID=UPI003F98B0A8